MRNGMYTGVFIVAFCGIWLGAGTGIPPATDGKTTIVLKDRAVVPGPVVSLGDIAVVEGDVPAFVDRIKDIKMSAAPPPIHSLSLSSQMVRFKLKENRVRDSEYTLAGAPAVAVQLDTVVIPGSRIISTARKYLEKEITVPNGERVIEFLTMPPPRSAAKRDISLKVKPTSLGRKKGSFSLYVGIYNDSRLYQSVPIQVRVRTFEKMVVATRTIPPGTVITEEDLELVTEESTKYNNHLIADKALIIGKETARTISAGQPVFPEYAVEPRIIRRGDIVTVEIQRGGVTITCRGTAKRDGRLGEVIPVSRAASSKILQATVKNSSTVVLN